MRKIFASVVFMILVFITTSALASGINVSWGNPDAGTIGFKVYYNTTGVIPMLGTDANEGNSPIIINDPNCRSIELTGLSTDTRTYVRISAFDSGADEGQLSDAKYYIGIKAFVLPHPTATYGVGDIVSFTIQFPTIVKLNAGILKVLLSTGSLVTTTDINWVSTKTLLHTVLIGEDANPLTISNIYLDPNDPGGDVALYDDNMHTVCLNLPDSNLDADPNSLIIIDTSAPNPPTGFSVGCAE